MLDSNTGNYFLFLGSIILALIYEALDYLGIEISQAITLCVIFFASGVVGILRTLSLNESLKLYITGDLLAKTLTLFLPFLMALIAKSVSVFHIFTDYAFCLLIVGEFLSILINIKCIKTRKAIQEIDIYNLFLDKFKHFSFKLLKLDNYYNQSENQDNKDKNNENQDNKKISK